MNFQSTPYISQFLQIDQPLQKMLSQLQGSCSIDKQNLKVLTSLQYLRNYTYLQFTLFPQLFPLFISQLTLPQLIDQVNSYVGTFLDFFAEEALMCESLYDGRLVKDVGGKVREDRKCSQRDQQLQQVGGDDIDIFLNNNKQILLQLIKLAHNQQASPQLMFRFAYKVNFLTNTHFLTDFSHQLSSRPLLTKLYHLLILLITQLFKHSPHSLFHCPMPKYLLHAIVDQLVSRVYGQLNILSTVQYCERGRLYRQVLPLIVRLKTAPVIVELYQLYQYVKDGRTRQYYIFLSAKFNQENLDQYLSLMEICADATETITTQKLQNNNKQVTKYCPIIACHSKTLQEMVQTVKSCFKTLKKDEDIGREKQRTLLERGKSLQLMKQLSGENVEKIAKLLSRIERVQGKGEKMQLQYQQKQEDKLSSLKTQMISQKHLTTFNIQVQNHLSFKQPNPMQHPHIQHLINRNNLSQDFLQLYFQLIELISQKDSPSVMEEEQIRFVEELMKGLLEMNNQSLRKVLGLEGRGMQEKEVEQAELQVNVLLEMVEIIVERWSGSLHREGQFVNSLLKKLSKTKHSLLANLLTTTILTHTIQNTHINQSHCQISHISSTPPSTFTIHTITQLFQQIFQLSQQQSTHASLQSVLYMFSAIQLWYQVGKQSGEIKKTECDIKIKKTEVQGFLDSVIRKYSQESVKIDEEEITFVKCIIMMFQLFKQTGNGNHSSKRDLNKVNEKINAMIKLSEQQRTSNIVTLINLTAPLRNYLQIIMLKLLSWCFPSGKDNDIKGNNLTEKQTSNQRDDFNEEHFKLPFWKILQLNNKPLNGLELVSYINTQILQQMHKVSLYQHTEAQPIDADNQAAQKDPMSHTIAPQTLQTISGLYQLFSLLKRKYLLSVKFQEQVSRGKEQNQIDGQNHQDQSLPMKQKGVLEQPCLLSNIWQHTDEKCFQFLLNFTETTWHSYIAFRHLNHQFHQLSNCQPSSTIQPTSHLHPSLTHLSHTLTQSIHHSIATLESQIITYKLLLYKLSSHQVEFLIQKQEGKQINQNSKERMMERVSVVNELLDGMVGLGLLGVSYLQWMIVESTFKKEIVEKASISKLITQKSTQAKQLKHNPSLSSSTFHLFRLINLLSWLPSYNPHIQTAFPQLQSHLQSNIQPIPTIIQSSIIKSTRFPKLPISSLTKKQLQFVSSYQFLEFVYQFVPFDINSEVQEKQLVDVSLGIVSNEDNHQYFSSQKQEKVTFNKVCQYLEWIGTSNKDGME